MSNKRKGALLTSIELAMECEWNTQLWEIQKDFEKLLQTNANHRLMICCTNDKNKEKVSQYFNDAIANYKNISKGSRFMISIWNNTKFEFQLIVK